MRGDVIPLARGGLEEDADLLWRALPRPGSAGWSEIRVLFAFDPTRSALLLLGGDKAGNWQRWYRQNIPIAEQLYLEYTTEQEE